MEFDLEGLIVELLNENSQIQDAAKNPETGEIYVRSDSDEFFVVTVSSM